MNTSLAPHNNAARTAANVNQAQNTQTNNRQTSGATFLSPPAPDFRSLQLLLLQLIIQLLSQFLQQQNPPTQPEAKPLDLSQSQQDNLKELFGFSPREDTTNVRILDQDGNGQVSVGDLAIINDSISGTEINRKLLTAEDIEAINQTSPGAVPAEFTANLQKWENASANANSISYTTQVSCFCTPEFTRPINVTEQNGEITNATYADDGSTVPQNVVDSLQTIDGRFEQLQNAYESNADRVDVTYDPTTGYPNDVFIDQSFMMADEEFGYTISNLNLD